MVVLVPPVKAYLSQETGLLLPAEWWLCIPRSSPRAKVGSGSLEAEDLGPSWPPWLCMLSHRALLTGC